MGLGNISTHKTHIRDRGLVLTILVNGVEDLLVAFGNRLAAIDVHPTNGDKIRIFGEQRGIGMAIAYVPTLFHLLYYVTNAGFVFGLLSLNRSFSKNT